MTIPSIVSTITLLDTVQGPSAPAYPSSTPTKSSSSVDPPPRATRHLSSSTSTPHRIFSPSWFKSLFGKTSNPVTRPARQNVFGKLKRGERNVLLAINDHGIISFLVSLSLPSSFLTNFPHYINLLILSLSLDLTAI
jgi:hypothetical protein